MDGHYHRISTGATGIVEEPPLPSGRLTKACKRHSYTKVLKAGSGRPREHLNKRELWPAADRVNTSAWESEQAKAFWEIKSISTEWKHKTRTVMKDQGLQAP